MKRLAIKQSFPSEIQCMGQRLLPRFAQVWDLGPIADLDNLIFANSTSRFHTMTYLVQLLFLKDATIFILKAPEHPSVVIGTVYLRPLRKKLTLKGFLDAMTRQPISGFVSNVAIHPDYRRQGLADWMMVNMVIPEARRQNMTQLLLNASEPFVQQFYHRLGFIMMTEHHPLLQSLPEEIPMMLNISHSHKKIESC